MWLLFYHCLYSIPKYELLMLLTSWPLLFADHPNQGQQLGRRLRLGLKRSQIRIFSMSLPGVFAGNPDNRNTTGSGRVWEQTGIFSEPRDKRKFTISNLK